MAAKSVHSSNKSTSAFLNFSNSKWITVTSYAINLTGLYPVVPAGGDDRAKIPSRVFLNPWNNALSQVLLNLRGMRFRRCRVNPWNNGFSRPGTTVITDECCGYQFLSREGYTHMRVNHSRNLVNRASGAHTQSIELLWSQAKRGNKIRSGTHWTSLPLHLCEFMWKKRLESGDDPFEKPLEDIAKFYPLQ
ncbi:hypothetical protein M514_05636 [Trichuris suis]|uniref:ISXO2-like transposase domain-containing protein n=1 Tax=Trichuris suis TaxID=68888 RepID=A0A085M8I4_9BILA|nr:hypothetical protein M513_05636 [Trichuris suis]KFD71799.1 hypothetical protein M514_05636 [Trichuris suis]